MVDGLLWVILIYLKLYWHILLFFFSIGIFYEYKYCARDWEGQMASGSGHRELSWLSEIVTMQENTWLGVKIKDKHLKFRDGGAHGLWRRLPAAGLWELLLGEHVCLCSRQCSAFNLWAWKNNETSKIMLKSSSNLGFLSVIQSHWKFSVRK